MASEKWTGRFWHYVFEVNGNAIGDFNMIVATTGLIIERDNGESTADKADDNEMMLLEVEAFLKAR